jgi:amino acid adenylation domain-containing protein
VYVLHQLLSESASNYPDKEAIIYRNDVMTYAQLDRESNAMAHFLLETGVERGERIGIYMDRSIPSIVSVFGILKSGATYVPIDPACPPNRFQYIAGSCGMKYILCTKEKMTNLERLVSKESSIKNILVVNGLEKGFSMPGSVKLIDWQVIRETSRSDAPGVGMTDRDLAYILFTSGSTGIPKGVMISHLNSLTFINAAYDVFRLTMNDRISNICPLHFDMSVFDLFVAMKAGSTMVIIPETVTMFPMKLAEVIAKNRITVWNSVPSALSLLATCNNLGDHDFSSLRLILFAGEVFPLKYLRILKEAIPAARFCNMYGQTEANSSTYYWVDDLPEDSRDPLPIGRALPNFDVFALDEEGKHVTEAGQEGELYVRASTVALGYMGDPERTEKSFVNNPLKQDMDERVYKTGDLVRLGGDGNYVFLGRKDHMIKCRGFRIEIGEIETVLCNHPEIKNAVVIPIPDELIGNRISAIVTSLKPNTISREDILHFCSQQLPRYMIPDSIEFRDNLPITSSGKVDRKKLSDQDEIASCAIN